MNIDDVMPIYTTRIGKNDGTNNITMDITPELISVRNDYHAAVVKWGEEPCPHTLLTKFPRHNCPDCWTEFREAK